MVLQLVNRLFIAILFLTSTDLSASSALDCRDVEIQKTAPKAWEKTILCFLREDSYFVSEACANLDCAFVKRLRELKVVPRESGHSAATACKALGGIKEEISISFGKSAIKRCLFTKEKISVSFNFLESWNGKHFTGPSKAKDLR
jgi:hypothetical protein